MRQNEQKRNAIVVENHATAPFRRPHGTQLVVATRRGKHVTIPCPRCRRRTDERFWHVELEQGICDLCWRELAEQRIPMAL